MYQRRTGSYDEIPEGMKRYINNYGCHFNKKLVDEAVRRMYYIKDDKKTYVAPLGKERLYEILNSNNITLERDKLYDAVYVANMCKADFYGKSVPNEECLAKFVKDMIDDPDADEGYIFNRFYADTVFMDNPIEWDDMV